MNPGLFVFDRWSTLGIIALVLDLLALLSIWFSRKHSPRTKVVWTLIVLLLPLFGALAWFALGRERRRTR